jgi:hypothetical protein
MLFTARRIANSWLDGASTGSVEGTTGSRGVVSAEAAAGPMKQTNSAAATTLRMRRFSDISGVGAPGYLLLRITTTFSNRKLCAVSS